MPTPCFKTTDTNIADTNIRNTIQIQTYHCGIVLHTYYTVGEISIEGNFALI